MTGENSGDNARKTWEKTSDKHNEHQRLKRNVKKALGGGHRSPTKPKRGKGKER